MTDAEHFAQIRERAHRGWLLNSTDSEWIVAAYARLAARVALLEAALKEHATLPRLAEDGLCPDCGSFVEWRDDGLEYGVCDPCAAQRLALLHAAVAAQGGKDG